MNINLSNLGKVDWKDLLKTVFVIILTTLLGVVVPPIKEFLDSVGTDAPLVITDVFTASFLWGALKTALYAGAGYLFKNLLTNSEGKFLKKE